MKLFDVKKSFVTRDCLHGLHYMHLHTRLPSAVVKLKQRQDHKWYLVCIIIFNSLCFVFALFMQLLYVLFALLLFIWFVLLVKSMLTAPLNVSQEASDALWQTFLSG